MRKIFVTGIGTGIGKTVVSAILTEALKADYWKPIQAGDLDDTDTMKVKALVSNTQSQFHPETYQLNHPMSPHAAADLDGIKMELKDFELPFTQNPNLIIEGAGGLMVPINRDDLMLDLAVHLGAEVVLVSQNYLGSINHTLMTEEILSLFGLPTLGIIFNGEENKETEKYILEYTGLECLGKIRPITGLSKDKILNLADQFRL